MGGERVPRPGSVLPPPGWSTGHDPDSGVLLAARAPRGGADGFTPTLVLAAGAVAGDREAWQAGVLAREAATLDRFEEEDADDYDLAGHQVRYRRLSFRAGRHDLLVEQWSWLVDGVGYTLSGTVSREEYADLTDVFEAAAQSFEVAAMV